MSTPKAKLGDLALIAALCGRFILGLTAKLDAVRDCYPQPE